ncbi:VOC family protein [Ramlibacter sp. AW1]|uniref:VOC family protein n=1 Tax=Ramlibacter aurantiacus TaxID=2801330 RepID=A0A936ZPB8_9BURK|nr:VOC family protein [Ramlibacter aurantiacus]MBL0423437.1 VOC family protein [Ramlibacter aurantiacus]
MPKVSELRRVALRVPDMEAACAFYETVWAMDPGPGASGERSYRSRGENHDDLLLVPADGPGLDHLGLGVESEAGLHAIVRRVRSAGGTVLSEPAPGSRAGDLLVAAVADADGNRVELIVPSQPSGPRPIRSKRHLGHAVLWTPQATQQEAFYALLGFQVSDRTHIGMSFLRCNTDHHSLALAASRNGRRGLQHLAFDIGNIDDVMREYARIRSAGADCIWGVGRHGPGNNVFAYFRDPAGHVVEYYGDMETVESAEVAQVRYWGPEHKGDIWNIAGAPPVQFRDESPSKETP